MIIKEDNKEGLFKKIVKNASFKFFFILLLVFTFSLSFVSLGVHLQYTGKNRILKGWVTGILNEGFNFIPHYLGSLFSRSENLDINIKFEDYQKLAYKRSNALNKGSLISSEKDWVSGNIKYNNNYHKVDVRLKGDLPDHWEKDNMWSLKIKVKGDKTIMGMKRFAIQSPDTRGYLNEYVFQKLLEYNNLISLRYDFIKVSINGIVHPIYAMEENFDKLLIENNRLREGPIFQIEKEIGIYKGSKRLWGSIKPYQKKELVNNKILSKQFSRAQSLFELFRKKELEVSKVFDVEKLATLFAIVELMGNHHASHLDNLKFYFNPITSLIEPIGYDNQNINSLDKNEMFGENFFKINKKLEKKEVESWYDLLFNDYEFYSEYALALEKISKKEYLDEFFKKINFSLDNKLKILHKSYPWYSFKQSKKNIYDNSNYIRKRLIPNSDLINVHYIGSENKSFLQCQFINLNTFPIEIVGYEIGDLEFISLVDEFILFPSVNRTPIEKIFQIPKNIESFNAENKKIKFYFNILGLTSIHEVRILPWSYLNKNLENNESIDREISLKKLDFLTLNEDKNEIYFKKGSHKIDNNIIFPKEFKIYINAGTKIDILNSSNIISFSPVFIQGENENPVIITSSDYTGQGFSVFNCDEESIINYVTFSNLSNLSKDGWFLTGAVNFYQSPVNIKNSRFQSMNSEDALNIIKSKVHIEDSFFTDSFSDAIDCDFAFGKIINSYFDETGNDAIDLSGSDLILKNISIVSTGDKAISAGEASVVKASNIKIVNSELGVTSKDLSKFYLDEINIENTKIGLLAFQKKSEFGKAEIIANNIKMLNVEIPDLIEKKSVLVQDGEIKSSNNIGVEDLLYGAVYGKSSK